MSLLKLEDFYTNPVFLQRTVDILRFNGFDTELAEDMRAETVMRINDHHIEGRINLKDILKPEAFYYAYCRLTILDRNIRKKYGIDNVSKRFKEEDHESTPDDIVTDSTYDEVDRYLNENATGSWDEHYNKKLFYVYLQEGSLRKVCTKYDLPMRSIQSRIKQVKYEIIEKLKK